MMYRFTVFTAFMLGLCIPAYSQSPLMYYSATPGSKWNPADIGVVYSFSSPAIAVRSNGEADVVAEEIDHSLWYYWATPGSPWHSAQLPGSAYSSPAIAVRSTGEADVVAQGPNNSLWYYWANPGSQVAQMELGADCRDWGDLARHVTCDRGADS